MLTWKPNYQEFQEMFANDYCLMILLIIHQQNQKNLFPCAADISKILDIHITTVSKYLELLTKFQFIKKDQKFNKPGKPSYYKIQRDTLTINLEFSSMIKKLGEIIQEPKIHNLLIREKPNLSPRVEYFFKSNGTIKKFIVQQKTKAKRIVRRNIILSDIESNFMKFLPYPTMEFQSFIDICKNAGISDVITIKTLLPFLEKLEKYAIIEVKEIRGDSNE